MFATKSLERETVDAAFYFAADLKARALWPRQNTLLWRCLSMLIAGMLLTETTLNGAIGEGRLDRLIYVLRGLGWPIKSYVATSVSDVIDESKLSYFIEDIDKRNILGGDI